jgi:hypothetical protein
MLESMRTGVKPGPRGDHEVRLPAKAIAPGHYLLELHAGTEAIVKDIATF